MRPQSADTHPEAERVQIELLRQAGPARRVEMALALSEMVRALSWQTVQERFADLTYTEQRLKFLALGYGEELAERGRVWLAEHGRTLTPP